MALNGWKSKKLRLTNKSADAVLYIIKLGMATSNAFMSALSNIFSANKHE